jgi:hypothetical protein
LLQLIDQIDQVEEAASGAVADAASSNSDGEMGLSGAGPADQDGVALLDDKAAAREVLGERLVDRRTLELEVVEVLGEWQLGDGELVFDRSRLLLVDLRRQQIANDALRLMLAFDSGGHDLVEGVLHAVELELTHEVEQLSVKGQ